MNIPRYVTHRLLVIHRDRRGNISVLLLLTIFALIGLIGLVWNTAELATRKQSLQTAADTSAHAASTWMARCTNLVAAQNMVICQDGSAEVIWHAIPPTDTAVRTRLEQELSDAHRMLNGGDPQFAQLRNQMLDGLRRVDDEYAQASSAWQNVNALSTQRFANLPQGIAFRTSVRQAGEILNWVSNTYVDGNPTDSPLHPGPPGPGGEGLRALVGQWTPPTSVAPCLQAIITAIQRQTAVLVGFRSHTASAVAQNVPARSASHRAEVFASQQQMVSELPATIARQLSAQADFYKMRLTVATTGRGAQPQGPAQIQAPIVAADDPSLIPEPHFDSLRGGMVSIDPINVHADAAAIVWPNPESRSVTIAGRTISFTVNCNIGGGWGHLYAAPLKRYFDQRVWNDQQGLSAYMQQIDDLRQQLAQTLRQLRGLPAKDRITPLPAQLKDTEKDAADNNPMIPLPPRLTPPDDASDQLRAQVVLYNQHAGAYTGAVRTLAGLLGSWAHYYDRFTIPFAVDVWHGQIEHFRHIVLKQLGQDKRFMVLATYRLRPIPQWAQAGMRVSAETAIRDRIVSQNIGPVGQQVLAALVGADPNGAGGGFLDPSSRNSALSALYSGQASQAAFAAVNSVAAQVAPQIAAEWVSRPWPYEISPPDTRVPPGIGMTKADRQTYFSLTTAVRPSADNSPRLILPKLTGATVPQLLAYAQAESFNWMEFNAAYGGSERFDEVTADPNAFFIGCPLAWRLCSIGGWNWNSKLAVADALSGSLTASPELSTFFQEGGVTGNDPQAIDTVTLH